jgi:hypothetical protein
MKVTIVDPDDIKNIRSEVCKKMLKSKKSKKKKDKKLK